MLVRTFRPRAKAWLWFIIGMNPALVLVLIFSPFVLFCLFILLSFFLLCFGYFGLLAFDTYLRGAEKGLHKKRQLSLRTHAPSGMEMASFHAAWLTDGNPPPTHPRPAWGYCDSQRESESLPWCRS